MKIGLTATVLGNKRTGISVWVESVLKSLQAIDRENSYELFFLEGQEIELSSPLFKGRSLSPLASNPIANILWHNLVLPKIVSQEKLDLVHIPSIRRIPIVKKCPIVATVHDLAPLKMPGKYGKWRDVYHQKFLTRAVHFADRVIVPSEHTKKDLIELTWYSEDKIHLIDPGIDHSLFFPKEHKERPPFFVYVSRIEHPGKNHIRAIEAFCRFKKRTGLPHRLLFAGADWQGAEGVKRYAAASAYSDSIEFLGFVPNQEIANLYQECELMFYPSLYEGFGLPVIEAMASGAPVICSNCSSLKTISEGIALQFDPYNPELMADALEKGLDRKWQQKSREKGLLKAKKYTWDETARQILQVYKGALS